MKAEVTWLKNGIMVGKCKGHSVLMDVPEDAQSITHAPSPMDILLIGAGGCTSYDVVTQLEEAGHNITDCQVSMTANLREEAPETFQSIHVQYHITGQNLERSAIEESVRMSQETYSGALISLSGVATISSDIIISEVTQK